MTSQKNIFARRGLVVGGVLVAAALLPCAAFAQAWPGAKQITFLNPFPAGGGTDAFARPLAPILDQLLGQRIIIDNRGGAGGTVGAAAAAKMEPDGYTFFVGAAHHTIAPAIYPNLPYDLEKDFIPIGMIAMPPQVVAMSPKALPGVNTLAEFMAYAKANPGKINFASSGNGTTHHMAGELFKLTTGLDLTHVPYRGAGPAMQDLVSGVVHVMFDGLGSSAPQIQGGTIKGLAVAAAKRSDAVPDVPTAIESGVKGYEVSTWYALWAIKGTPQPIIDRMQAELKKALATEQIKSHWAKNGSEVPNLYGADFGKFVNSEIARWGQVVKAANVKLQ